jgi:serine/threonine protein kinase
LAVTDVTASALAEALRDRYTLARELGRGGTATVYLARDLRHDRDVALKVLRPDLAAVLGRERFLAEIRLPAKLDHPHILTLIDSGESNDLLWYVVPFIRGESLRQKLIREKQLPLDEAQAITKQVASAREYAHQQGVIHRDLKPENILLHEGEAMLADFGIALAVKEAGGNRLTETGLSLGTPQYMSPEQATGSRDLDARSDVYSLAAGVPRDVGRRAASHRSHGASGHRQVDGGATDPATDDSRRCTRSCRRGGRTSARQGTRRSVPKRRGLRYRARCACWGGEREKEPPAPAGHAWDWVLLVC